MEKNKLEQLIKSASGKLGTTPEKLKSSLEKGDVKALSANLSKADKEKLKMILNNKELMNKLKSASDPEEMARLLGKK